MELTGILSIGNKVLEDNTFIGIIFKTKLLEENISYDKNEILDVKWFSYEEMLNMKDELRNYDWIIDSIEAYINKTEVNTSLIKVYKK